MSRLVWAACLAGALTACGPPQQTGEERVVERPAGNVGSSARGAATASGPGGVAIRYDDQGQGDPAIVFVHGWSCDRGYWAAQRDHFARRHRVVTVDLAGHGESGQDRDDWSMGAFGGDVAAVVEALDLRGVVLVGHSMGGPVVLEAARQLDERVAAVVGVDTLRDVSRRLSEAELDARLAELDADFGATVTGIVTGMFVPASDPALRDHVVQDMASAPPRVARGALLGLVRYDARPALAALDVPFALINSDYQPTNVTTLGAAARSFEYFEMSGVGHFVMMEDPDTFNGHLEAVIESLAP